MEQRVTLITLGVDDLERSIRAERSIRRGAESWRRGRDLNPRWVAPYRISSAAP
jgi:hypothetical protein